MSKLSFPAGIMTGALIGVIAFIYIAPSNSIKNAQEKVDLSTFPIRGEISLANPINHNDGSRYSLFAVQPDRHGLLKIEQSGALNGYLTIYRGSPDEDSSLVSRETYLNHAYIWVDDVADDAITIVVNGQDANSFGPFRLQSEWLDIQNDAELAEGTRIDGFMNGAVNEYTLVIEEEGLYQIDMRSDDFDSYLRMNGNGLDLYDDDGGEGLNARIVSVFQPGTYRVEATSPYVDSAKGLYDIEFTRIGLDENFALHGAIELNQTVRGLLYQQEVIYQLHLSEDRAIEVDVRSDNFDTVVDLRGTGVFLTDDDGGEGTNSRLYTDVLEAGDYTIRVYPYSSGNGEFELTVR